MELRHAWSTVSPWRLWLYSQIDKQVHTHLCHSVRLVFIRSYPAQDYPGPGGQHRH